MSKTTIASRLISLAVLIALLLAAFPTTSAVAKGPDVKNLEDKWDQLVSNYNCQTIRHGSVHKHVDHWMATNKNASAADKAKLERHVAICNSALASAGKIVGKHAGFHGNGKVIDKALARQSIKQLTDLLEQHARSVARLEVRSFPFYNPVTFP